MPLFNCIFMLKLNKIKSIVFATAFASFIPFISYQDSHAETNIAIADTNRIMETSLAYKDIVKQLEKKYEDYKDSIQKIEAQLKKRYQELEAQKNALSKEAFDTKNEELEKDANELRRKSYNERNILEKAQVEAIQKLSDKVLEIAQSKAKNLGYNLVFDKGAAVYADEKLDITSTILEDLDKNLPTVSVDFESARKGAENTVEETKEKVSKGSVASKEKK